MTQRITTHGGESVWTIGIFVGERRNFDGIMDIRKSPLRGCLGISPWDLSHFPFRCSAK